MSYSITYTLHLLAAVIWVGGMFFAHMILRPSAIEMLDPPHRLPLWVAVFRRFFFWVWISITILFVTGYWIIFDIFGGLLNLKAVHIQLMHLLGWIMLIIFGYIFFAPYQKLKTAVEEKNFPLGGQHINKIRLFVTINLLLGILIIIIASAGKYINL